MTICPIIFSAPMIRALIENRKTMTRLIIKPQPDEDGLSQVIATGIWHDTSAREYPLAAPGDMLSVMGITSRLILEVTGVKVERVQDISCADALDEGISPAANSQTIDCDTPNPKDDFRTLWDSLNKHRGYGWAENPWVAAISFRCIHKNVDQINKE